jgi:hypothetical protein
MSSRVASRGWPPDLIRHRLGGPVEFRVEVEQRAERVRAVDECRSEPPCGFGRRGQVRPDHVRKHHGVQGGVFEVARAAQDVVPVSAMSMPGEGSLGSAGMVTPWTARS